MNMKATASKKDLLEALARSQGMTDKKSTLPILAHVLLRAEGDALSISATDLVLSLRGSIKATVAEPGSVSIAARDLLQRIQVMPDGDVTLQTEDGAVTIKSALSARAFAMGSFVDGEEYPALPESPADGWQEFPADTLARLIESTHFAVSTDETRLHLSSALFEVEKDLLRMVSTDGHRLAKMEVKCSGVTPIETMLIPRKGVTELQKLLGNTDKVLLRKEGLLLFVSFDDDITFTVKLVDAQFPPYQQVIPTGSTDVMVVKRAALAAALKAVAISASNRTGGVKLSLNGEKLLIETESPEAGSGRDELAITREQTVTRETGLNAKYLLDAIGASDSTDASIGFGEMLDPVLITDDSEAGSFLGVIMPMRI
jgi:DNA polymerase-3 subunit beta